MYLATSIPRTAAAAAIRFYRFALSPLLGSRCRFHPSCSAYAEEAMLRHGLVRGSLLAASRIARCNPMCEGGLDPVPDTFTLRRPRS
ncbi:MAG TPA: membrane protein insertion efficiency factor YidD [Candidatus Saccharimonadia bacterium]|nr:membrane protein insertion efficiency factor YidD [Candidatus Saccharimonadia bacterium]